jgi:hypothetical protein
MSVPDLNWESAGQLSLPYHYLVDTLDVYVQRCSIDSSLQVSLMSWRMGRLTFLLWRTWTQSISHLADVRSVGHILPGSELLSFHKSHLPSQVERLVSSVAPKCGILAMSGVRQ